MHEDRTGKCSRLKGLVNLADSGHLADVKKWSTDDEKDSSFEKVRRLKSRRENLDGARLLFTGILPREQ